MEKFFKRKISCVTSGSDRVEPLSGNPPKIDLNDLPWDPSERPKFLTYNPNQRDEIRRLYMLRGPCQPRGHEFPTTLIGDKQRRFVLNWFDEFRWLEYSVRVDKAYCLCCYLFREQGGANGDAFVTEGFNSWGKKNRLTIHEGDVNSFHNRAQQKCENLIRQNQSIVVALHKQTELVKNEHRIRLNASIDCARFLLSYGLPFRGHDESETSINQGLFLGLLNFFGNANETVRNVILQNAPKNNQMTSPSIQKDIISCFAKEILKSIVEEIGDDVFSLLVDESSDVSKKEQMAMVLRYVDTRGVVKERFIGIAHVMTTSSSYLKLAIDSLFVELGLSLKKVRGQGYDGANNTRGEFNGLKALILKDNNSAYYIHCFAHQLQLVVVAVAHKHDGVEDFFDMLGLVMNVVNASCKRKDMVREIYKARVEEAIGMGEVETGRGWNQELSLIRAGDTRWGSHHKTIERLITLFPEVIKVLKYIEKEADKSCNRRQAGGILSYFKTFDFVVYMHLMLTILETTNILSKALQRKDQNMVEAVSLIETTKWRLQTLRQSGFDTLLKEVYSFCELHSIKKVEMAEEYVNSKNLRKSTNITNRHHYEYDIFNTVVDMQIQEFGDRFNEVSTELLRNMVALSPCASFSHFDKSKLLRLSEFYPYDFNQMERIRLGHQLDMYHEVVHRDERFANLNGIDDLTRLMVETTKHISYPLVYRLLKLVLVLPVATSTVERCFSSMKLVKTYLRNRMGDDFLNDSVICSVENEALANVTNEDVITRFQKMKTRKEQL